MSWAEMIMGRDDPIFGTRILQSECFFRTGDIISQMENVTHFVTSQIRVCDITK